MERHPVPHNFMDVEFKLFGFFTVKQFGYLAVGFILSLLIYYSTFPDILKLIFIVVSMGSGLVLALVKINGQPSVIYVQNFITSLFEPQERLWKKTPVVPDILQESKNNTKVESNKELDSALSRIKVANIPDQPLAKLSEEEEKLDKFENDNLDKIDEHFDFLFNQVPEIQGEKSQMPSTDQVINVPPKNETMFKKPATIADSINQNLPGEKLYEGSNYAVSFKPMTSRVNRPINFNVANPTMAVVKNNNAKLYLTGIVVDGANQPLKSTRVDIIDLSGKLVRSLTTNNEGRFELINQLPTGDYYLDITKPDFNFDRISVNIEEGKLSDIIIKAKN